LVADRYLEVPEAAFFHHRQRRVPDLIAKQGLDGAFNLYLYAAVLLSRGKANDDIALFITAGFPLRKGEPGTLGELSPKPHPWLYAEAFRVGLGLPFELREAVLGVEDSGAGVCAVRLAGLVTVGVGGGNVEQSGLKPLCHQFCGSLEEAIGLLDGA